MDTFKVLDNDVREYIEMARKLSRVVNAKAY